MLNPYGNLLEESVHSASPMELTNMLFEKLLSEIRNARGFLRSNDAVRRSDSVSRAAEIVIELAHSLDDERGGDLSRSLRQLYAYVLEQLNEGHARQHDACFANAEKVVTPLADAWRQIACPEGAGAAVDAGALGWAGDRLAAGSLSYCG